MSGKQKVIIGIIGALMILTVIGLSIAIVLVASSASATATMKVSFTSYEVSATIDCSGSVVQIKEDSIDKINGDIIDPVTIKDVNESGEDILVNSKKLTFDAGEQEREDSVEFSAIEYSNTTYRIRYEFKITNTGTENNINVTCALNSDSNTFTNDNMFIAIKQDTDTVFDDDGMMTIDSVAPGEYVTIYLFVYVENPAEDGEFVGSALDITLTDTDYANL